MPAQRTVGEGSTDEGPRPTPLMDLQVALSKCVDMARALPKGSVSESYVGLVATYFAQVAAAVAEAQP